MAFKLDPPYKINWTSVFHFGESGNINGATTNSGNIILNKDITDPKQKINTLSHEMVHVHQIKRGDLAYDNKFFYWKGKKYPRGKKDGSPLLQWEQEAYKKEIKIKKNGKTRNN